MYDLNARYYDAKIARFLSPDPYYDLGNRVIGLYEINVPNAWSIIQANALYVYCGNDPISYHDFSGCKWTWKFWENWKISKNDTREIARTIIANPLAVYITQNGHFTDAFNTAGFFRDESGIYHTYQNAWQQIGGYNDLYDIVFDYSTSMKKDKFDFSVDNRDYIIWVWKGDYLNLGAGAELGIYSNESGIMGMVNVTSPHDKIWLIDTGLAMNMSLTLTYGGETIINYSPSEKQWWLTGFNPFYQNVNVEDLIATYKIKFDNKEMFTAFYDEYSFSKWVFDEDSMTAILEF